MSCGEWYYTFPGRTDGSTFGPYNAEWMMEHMEKIQERYNQEAMFWTPRHSRRLMDKHEAWTCMQAELKRQEELDAQFGCAGEGTPASKQGKQCAVLGTSAAVPILQPGKQGKRL
jgi:hypothetical protein